MTRRTYAGFLMVAALIAAAAVFVAACGGNAQTATTDGAGTTVAAGTGATVQSGTIIVSGLLDYPMNFTPVDMDYMDWVTVTAEDQTSGSTTYEGVRLPDIWTFLGVQDDATTVVITGVDGSKAEVKLADISSDAVLSVTDDNGFNMVMPGMDAQTWVKDVVRMEFK